MWPDRWAPRSPTYGPRIIAALIVCCAMLRAPAGKRLRRRCRCWCWCRDGELDLTDDEPGPLVRMSAATS